MADKKEKKLTEAEAKRVYEETRVKHEKELEVHRANVLEYTLACEDHTRAEDRLRKARSAKERSENIVYQASNTTTEAFIELGRVQIESRGGTGR